jgi:RHS repeat-associated protein
MTRRDVTKGATSLSYEIYNHNAMGQVTFIDREGTNDDRFNYYLDGELNWATYNGGAGSGTYTLDQAGNRLSVDYGSGAKTSTPDVINQYSVAEDDPVVNGSEHEIASVWGANYTYINDGPLTQIDNGVTSTQYAYDALRRLVRRGVNGATNRYEIYDGERSILEYNINGAIVGRNVYGKGIDEILMRTATGANGGQPFYYQQNHEGSVTQLTNATGAVIEKYSYDVFGAVSYYNASGTDIGATAYGNVYLFTGRRKLGWDTYHYRARVYNAYLGRFMSEDPKLFDAGDYNLFRYCHNDPLDLTDPMGLDFGDPFSSADTAARDFNRIYNPQSIRNNREFGAMIYKDSSGKYSYSRPKEGTSHDARVRTPIPKDTKSVGDVHSHGDYSRATKDEHGRPIGVERISKTDPNFRHDSFSSDHPSKSDQAFWHQMGSGRDEFTGYVTTPSGRMWKQDGVDQKSHPVEISPKQDSTETHERSTAAPKEFPSLNSQ